MENIENNQNLENTELEPQKISTVKILALSLLFGLIGGLIGSVIGPMFPGVKKYQLQNGQAVTQNISLTEDSAIIEVVKKASPAVVSIVISKDLSKLPGYGIDRFGNDLFSPLFGFGLPTENQAQPNIQKVGAGSGFFVSSDGLILTNKHVVSDTAASYTVITNDGKSYDAKVLSVDPVNDLAIVKISISGAPTLVLADSKTVQIGQRVVAIGNSLGQYQNTVTTGIVSGIGRSITAGNNRGLAEQLEGVIQTDAAINPGNSGGPLLNLAGQVVGINTAVDQEGQSVGFAIPSSDASRALASFNKNGKITRPYLGVRYVMLTKALAVQEKLPRDFGALIIRGQTLNDFAVIPGSPADKAGLVENDIILEINGKKLDENSSLLGMLKDLSPGDSLRLKIFHKDQEKELTIILGETE